MQVTLRSDDNPDVVLQTGQECCGLKRLDQHIRALQTARRWLAAEIKRRNEHQKQQAAAEKAKQSK